MRCFSVKTVATVWIGLFENIYFFLSSKKRTKRGEYVSFSNQMPLITHFRSVPDSVFSYFNVLIMKYISPFSF